MSILDGQELFDELSARTNRYAAVQIIAREARKRAEATGNYISHSEALSWVLTGHKPDKLVRAEKYGKMSPLDENIQDLVEEYLANVDVNAVKVAVRESIKQTIRNKNLVYVYNNISDSYRRGRVRVITRLLWDKIQDQFLR